MTGRKRLNLITGPSGGGKTVFCKRQPDWDHCVLNLDDFARTIGGVDNHACRERAWASLMKAAEKRMADSSPVISIDTVFGEREFKQVAELHRKYDYEVALWVFSPSSPDVCAQRVLQRERTGGHGDTQLASHRFDSSLSAASNFSLQCDYTFLIDTSNQLELVAWLEGFDTMEVFPNVPQWATEYFPV